MNILIVDDDKASREAAGWFLRNRGHKVTECSSGAEALALVSANDFPMILSDIKMPGMTGLELLTAIKGLPGGWRTDIVLFTGYGDMQSAIQALRSGAYDYILKPVDAQELAATAERIAEHQALLRENKYLAENLEHEVKAATAEKDLELTRVKRLVSESLFGQVGVFSNTMREVMALANKYHNDRSLPVLIEGETGTGKEIVARMIHWGDIKAAADPGPFVDINCAAISPSLFESELFGYEAGAYTGSQNQGQKGKLDIAAGGTIFLDEIAEMPPEMQVKLLRVIQEREYYRVGGLKKIQADVRIVCATNVDLEQRMDEGGFRRDLYYRFQIGHIVVPPLRERREEILPLANLFLQQSAKQRGRRFAGISRAAAQALENYDWPGNVRELKNTIEYIVFMYDDTEIRPEHIHKIEKKPVVHHREHAGEGGEPGFAVPFPADGFSLQKYNDYILREVLAAHNGNHAATANYLGISLRTLSYRIAKMKEQNKR
ncbi:MAG TPA: sigma-54 dependent transcriptional regulator [Selenomonadales bacterium]|nr:sigma-54 dependent transcriptional regulator [Selenomonadales bacterium]